MFATNFENCERLRAILGKPTSYSYRYIPEYSLIHSQLRHIALQACDYACTSQLNSSESTSASSCCKCCNRKIICLLRCLNHRMTLALSIQIIVVVKLIIYHINKHFVVVCLYGNPYQFHSNAILNIILGILNYILSIFRYMQVFCLWKLKCQLLVTCQVLLMDEYYCLICAWLYMWFHLPPPCCLET